MFNNAAIDGNPEGIRYTEIDMTLPGNGTIGTPTGDVTAIKDVELTSGVSVTEMLGAHAVDCNNYWVVGHEKETNNFISIKVTAAGPQAPVYTPIGPVLYGNAGRGTIKISPDGAKLIMLSGWPSGNSIYNFDKVTGIVSNSKTIPVVNSVNWGYGAEWSPNSQYLYFSGAIPSKGIYGYNLSNKSTFIVSPTLAIGDLEMAPDGKIYGVGSQIGISSVATISNPNDGTNAILDVNGYTMTTGSGNYGLPASYSCIVATKTPVINSDKTSINLKNNPVVNELVFSVNSKIISSFEVLIISLSGDIVYSRTHSLTDSEMKIDVTSFNSGTYLLRLLSEDKEIISQKFIKVD